MHRREPRSQYISQSGPDGPAPGPLEEVSKGGRPSSLLLLRGNLLTTPLNSAATYVEAGVSEHSTAVLEVLPMCKEML